MPTALGKRSNLRRGLRLLTAAVIVGIASGCGSSGAGTTAKAMITPSPASTPSAAASPPVATPVIQDVMALGEFSKLTPGTYSIDPDGDPSTPLRVVYEVAADGWQQWIGAAKFSDVGHTGLSITTVTNLVTDGCRNHSWADPPVGPSVSDLARALSDLAPFQVTAPATDVTVYGFRGKHIEWTVPDLTVEGTGGNQTFVGCIGGALMSWVAFIDTVNGDAFYGYTGPGYREEFWILDVDGTRLMIAAEDSRGSPKKDLAERDEVLASIRIEP